ncbi:MAG: BlaI/MecI/CopY family transcriptional regulator [Acidobacteriota bacterium]|nr:BlaI/MecI/CopY family transcriptional regulator [Acidobacteriota bacterium]
MKRRRFDQLSRRERQIMESIYRAGQATATEVLESLPDPPSYSTVRALLRILETKGHLRHVAEGTRYVFLPVVAPDRARRSAIQSLLETFFEGSREKAVAALLDASRSELSDTELDRISQLIENAREEGR